VRFQPLATHDVAGLLLERGLCSDSAAAQRAAERSGGSLERAAQWCDEALVEFRRELLAVLALSEPQQSAASKLVGQFVDEGGKEFAAKRNRLRLVVSLAEEFYRAALLSSTSGISPADSDLSSAVDKALGWMPPDGPVACLDICHDAYAHIDANVNQATFVEWFLDELAAAARSGRIAA
jgi:hypothetical protein